jgi:hypothetical protein
MRPEYEPDADHCGDHTDPVDEYFHVSEMLESRDGQVPKSPNPSRPGPRTHMSLFNSCLSGKGVVDRHKECVSP